MSRLQTDESGVLDDANELEGGVLEVVLFKNEIM